jgi:hypothetical protein
MTITGATSKEILLTNDTPLPIPFFWTMTDRAGWFPQNQFERPSEEVFYIQPYQGEFPPMSSKKFMLTFLPTKPILFRNEMQLVLEIPQKTGAIATTFMRLGLQGRGKGCEVTLDPPAMLFGSPGLQIGNVHTRKFLIMNQSKIVTHFQWCPNRAARQGACTQDVKNAAPTTHHIEIMPSEGSLAPMEQKELTLTMRFDTLESIEEEIPCRIANGSNLYLRLQANVAQPKLRFLESEADLGLLNFGIPGVQTTYRLRFANVGSSIVNFAFCESVEHCTKMSSLVAKCSLKCHCKIDKF